MDRDAGLERLEREHENHASGPEREGSDERENRVRRSVRSGRQVYSISPDERQSMYDMGRFRVLSNDDLLTIRYQKNNSHMQQDLRSLSTQGLVQRKSVWRGKSGQTDTFWALTKAGKRFLKRQFPLPSGQALYTGFVKPAELRHDAAVYKVYQREAAQIEKDGGRVRRVVLDYELKKKAYSPLAKAKALPPAEYAKRQAEIAEAHGLKVVKGHIVLPDLRIEYLDRNGVAGQVDLEVATESYHGSHAAEKAAAGFKIYAAGETAGRLSRALEEREITAEIFSL
jgi:transposase